MILGQGAAQTEQDIMEEYGQFLVSSGHIRHEAVLKRHLDAPAVMRRRIGKPIREWSDEDVFALFEDRAAGTAYAYNTFLTFLFFRGYRRASVSFLARHPICLCRYWALFLAPYKQKIRQAAKELGYTTDDQEVENGAASKVLNMLLMTFTATGKSLEDLTRTEFDVFFNEYQHWYQQSKQRKTGKSDVRLYRLERYLVHWRVLPPAKKSLHHEKYFAQIRHAPIQAAISRYMKWCDVKYRANTIDNIRRCLWTFFIWLQEHYPVADRLDAVTRDVALTYGQHLKELVEVGQFKSQYQGNLYTSMRQFFDFVIDEQAETAPSLNPFSSRDLPRRPDMLPRYISDQDLRKVLEYCEHDASPLERTLVITLLHTGIRASEFSQLKASDIVQIGGIWKLHIHEGKGLKDRLIPLTPQCLSVLQTWKEKAWERISEHLFTRHGRAWSTSDAVCTLVRGIGRKAGVATLTPHRFRHSFAVALLNYGIRESALQKLMGHATLGMTLEYARILDHTVEQSFTEAIEQMHDGAHSWVPNFFIQEEFTLFVEGDVVSWIRLPLGYCRRNPKLHCESDVKCLLCDRFAIGKEDLPGLQQMHERFLKLGLTIKADVVAAQIRRLELPGGNEHGPQGFIPTTAISVARKR